MGYFIITLLQTTPQKFGNWYHKEIPDEI